MAFLRGRPSTFTTWNAECLHKGNKMFSFHPLLFIFYMSLWKNSKRYLIKLLNLLLYRQYRKGSQKCFRMHKRSVGEYTYIFIWRPFNWVLDFCLSAVGFQNMLECFTVVIINRFCFACSNETYSFYVSFQEPSFGAFKRRFYSRKCLQNSHMTLKNQ